MHKVFITTYLWNGSDKESATHWAALDTVLELPFPPFFGLEIILKNGLRRKLERISWSIENNTFQCTTNDTYIIPLDTERLNFEDLIECFVADQWMLTGPYPNEQ